MAARLVLLLTFALSACAALHTATGQGADAPQGVLATGETFHGEVAQIDSAWKITFDNAPADHRAQDIAWWGSFTDSSAEVQILLTGGGWLVGQIDAWSARSITVSCDLCYAEIPLEQIAGVLMHPPAEPLARDRLRQRIAKAEGRSDRVLFTNGDELDCVVLNAQTEIGSRYPSQIEIRPTGVTEKVDLPGERVSAVIVNPALAKEAAKPPFYVALGFADGSLIYCRSLRGSSPLQLELVGGLTLQVDPGDFYGSLRFLQSYGGEVTWLSSLPAAAYRHTPFLDLSWPYHLDRNTQGGALRSQSETFLSGVGMHSRSRLAFSLGGKFTRFDALLAIDRLAGTHGSVVFRAYLNRQGVWSPAFQSAIVRGGQQPIPMTLDVTNAAAILLIVDYADHGDELDYANWINARVK